jgi:hypothetical protein
MTRRSRRSKYPSSTSPRPMTGSRDLTGSTTVTTGMPLTRRSRSCGGQRPPRLSLSRPGHVLPEEERVVDQSAPATSWWRSRPCRRAGRGARSSGTGHVARRARPHLLFIAWISRTRARSTLRAVERDGRNLIVRLTCRVFVLGGILGQERPLAARLLGHLRLSAALLTPERALSVASGSTPKQRGFAVCR